MITITDIDTLNIPWADPGPWDPSHYRRGRKAVTSTGCKIDYRPGVDGGIALVTTPDGTPRPCRSIEEIVDWLVTTMMIKAVCDQGQDNVGQPEQPQGVAPA